MHLGSSCWQGRDCVALGGAYRMDDRDPRNRLVRPCAPGLGQIRRIVLGVDRRVAVWPAQPLEPMIQLVLREGPIGCAN